MSNVALHVVNGPHSCFVQVQAFAAEPRCLPTSVAHKLRKTADPQYGSGSKESGLKEGKERVPCLHSQAEPQRQGRVGPLHGPRGGRRQLPLPARALLLVLQRHVQRVVQHVARQHVHRQRAVAVRYLLSVNVAYLIKYQGVGTVCSGCICRILTSAGCH